jgi:hypothetical protein
LVVEVALWEGEGWTCLRCGERITKIRRWGNGVESKETGAVVEKAGEQEKRLLESGEDVVEGEGIVEVGDGEGGFEVGEMAEVEENVVDSDELAEDELVEEDTDDSGNLFS